MNLETMTAETSSADHATLGSPTELCVERVSSIPAAFFEPYDANQPGLLTEWRALAGDRTLCDSPWLLAWWSHFGENPTGRARPLELCLLTVRDEQQQLVGLAPWYIDYSLKQGGVLRYLGSGIVCTDYLTILTHVDRQAEVIDVIADWLCGAGCDTWERMELVGTDDADTAIPRLMQRLTEAGHHLHRRPGDNTWRVELPATWEEFLGGMSARRRNRVRKMIRTEFDSGLCEVRNAHTPQEFEEHWRIFERLHQARRVSVGDPGVFADPMFADFIRDTGRRLFDQQRLDLLVLKYDDDPVAVEFNPTGDSIIWGYQGGIDPGALDKRPGNLMIVARLRRAIEHGRAAADLMRGDEPYKAEWGATRRPSTEYRVVKRTPMAQLRHGVWQAGQQLRQFAKQGVSKARQVWSKG